MLGKKGRQASEKRQNDMIEELGLPSVASPPSSI